MKLNLPFFIFGSSILVLPRFFFIVGLFFCLQDVDLFSTMAGSETVGSDAIQHDNPSSIRAAAEQSTSADGRAHNIFEANTYTNPKSSASLTKLTTLELHTAGEPLRIVIDGLPTLPLGSCLEKRQFFMDNYDHIRKALLQEPRGHADQYGAILTLPNRAAGSVHDDVDVDIFFMNTKGYSPMCGHGTIAIAKALAEMGIGKTTKDGVRTITMNSPAGPLLAHATLTPPNTVISTSFINVPSFVYLRDATVKVPDLGPIKFDIAFGGAFFAIISVSSLPPSRKVTLDTESYPSLIALGRLIKSAIVLNFPIHHPTTPAHSSLFGVLFVSPPYSSTNHSRNVNVYEDGIVDRSPTGTGVSARAALLHARGELGIGEKIEIESIIGSTMTVEVKSATTFGGYEAVVPEVGGKAFGMGRAEWWIDEEDKVGEGFVLR